MERNTPSGRTLEPIAPDRFVEMYLKSIEHEKAQSTVYSHGSRLSHFVEWCEETEITNMNELTGRDCHEYKLWRREHGDINTVTLKTQLDTLRVALRWGVTVDAVHPSLPEKVVSPPLNDGQNARDEMLDGEVAREILGWLETYRYCSPEHITLMLMSRCLLRRGAVRALSLEDYQQDEQLLYVRHRPEIDCPLKNQGDGERPVALKQETCAVLDDYIDTQRHDVTDNIEPLITTQYGRPHAMTIASWIYGVTRPCVSTGECPHGREIDECEAAQRREDASKCPSSASPHMIRRGAITEFLRSDVPEAAVSGRADVSPTVIESHYDRRDPATKAEQRRKYIDRVDY